MKRLKTILPILLGVIFCQFSTTTPIFSQNALHFDGIDDFVFIPTSTSLNISQSQTITIEAWIRPNSFSGIQGIVVKQIDYGIFLNNNVVSAYNWNNAGLNGIQYFINGTVPLNVNQWYHVAFTFNNGVAKLYVNGSLQATDNNYTVAVNTNHDVGIGTGSVDNLQQLFDGRIDEVRIWDIERTDFSDRNSELTLPYSANLLLYFKMNEGTACGDNSGSSTTTDSKNGITATLTNMLRMGSTSNWIYGFNNSNTNCPVLSVELGAFSAKPFVENPKWVVLNWETANEQGRNEFDIERSRDGRNFQKIATLAAKGTADKYQFIDENPLHGTAYYRLKINDLGGEKLYSKVVAVVSKSDAKVKIYPSVFAENLTIDGAKTFEIVNAIGQIVERGTVSEASFQLSLSVPKGIYVVRGLDTEGGLFAQKIIKN
jgi:hypothetical protein